MFLLHPKMSTRVGHDSIAENGANGFFLLLSGSNKNLARGLIMFMLSLAPIRSLTLFPNWH